MRKFKKFATGALVATMMFSLVACGGNGSKDPTSTPKPTEPAVETSGSEATKAPEQAATQAPEPTEEAKVDLGGYEYVIACFYGGHVWHPAEGNSEIDDLMLERYRQIEEDYNCTITFIDCTPDEMVDGINTSVATGIKYADQVHVNMDVYGKLTRAGYLTPVNELPYINLNDEKWNRYYYPVTTSADGNLYGLDFLSWPTRKPYPDQCIFFNKDLIAELGLKDPYEMYDNGEWTWDNFRQYLKDATRDTNGDGEIDVYGISCVDVLFEYAALFSNGVHTFDIVDGKYQFNMATDAAYRALQFASDIRNVDKTFRTYTEEDGDWYTPLRRFRESKQVFVMRDVIFIQDTKEENMNVGMLPFPKGPDLTGDYPTASWNSDTQVQSFLKTGVDLDKAAFIFNKITEPFDEYPMGSWEEYATRNHFRKDEKAFSIFKEMSENAYPDGFAVYGGPIFVDVYQQAIRRVANMEQTPAEAISSIQEQMQAYLDDNINK